MTTTGHNVIKGRSVLITGASGAIGAAIARRIAAEPGYRVVLACRNENKARSVAHEIIRSTGNQNVNYELVDVARRASIEALAKRWQGALHVLVNNAATTSRQRRETPEGIEMQFATNVLGYFWMTQAFSDILKRSTPARVINVASYWAGNLDLDDLEFWRRPYDNNQAYRQSKQANRMLTVAFAKRLADWGIAVNACHPGDVNSQLSNDLGFGGHESPDEGARTPAWLATGAMGVTQTGQYFERMKAVRDRFGEDFDMVERLYRICLERY